MVVAGLIVCIISFVVYFGLLGTVIKSTFFCILLTLTALVGLGLTSSGYEKSYKKSKRNLRTLKDRWKMMTSCFLTGIIFFVSYHILFRLPETVALIYALPYVFPVLFIVWMAGFLTIRRKMRTVAKMDSASRICAVCGNSVGDSMNYCGKCWSPLKNTNGLRDSPVR